MSAPGQFRPRRSSLLPPKEIDRLEMTSCLAELSLSFSGINLAFIDGGLLDSGLFNLGLLDSGLVLGQALKWLPAWLTPLWVIGAGITFGIILAVAVYGVLGFLSFIPPLGSMADEPKQGVIASLVVGAIAALALCSIYVPSAEEYNESLVLPLICIGLLLGFGFVYGLWHRTRAEWGQILTEGIVPYLLAVAGIFVLIGLIATPMVSRPMEFVRSIQQVNLVGDGTERLEVIVPAIDPNSDPDDSDFVPANISYNLRSAAQLSIESDRNILIADSSDPGTFSRRPQQVFAGEKMEFRSEDRQTPPIPGDSSRLHIQNREINPARVVFTFKYVPTIPEASTIVMLGVSSTVIDWLCTPPTLQRTKTAPSSTRSERSTSTVKSTWPGVSIRLIL